MSPDPFMVLKDQLVAAEAGAMAAPAHERRRRRWSGRRPLLALLAALAVSGTATAAVLTLTGGQPSAPLRGDLPGQKAGAGAYARHYAIAVTPNLSAGSAGWCTRMSLRTGTRLTTVSAACGLAAPSGAALIAGGNAVVSPTRMLSYAVVDRRVAAVELAHGLRVTPSGQDGLPFGWRAAVAFVPVTRSRFFGEATRLTLLDARGRPISQEANRLAGTYAAGTRPLPATPLEDPAHPPVTPCALRSAALAHLERIAQRVVVGPLARDRDTNGRALLACSAAEYRLRGHRLRAGVLVDADSPRRAPVAIPGAARAAGHPGVVDAPGLLSARRVGRAWLVVDGADRRARLRLLAALTFRQPSR
jgi:hypothetical protein